MYSFRLGDLGKGYRVEKAWFGRASPAQMTMAKFDISVQETILLIR